MKSLKVTLDAALLLLSCSAYATFYNVPGDTATIQDAINLCVDGDSVVVEPGTYTGTGNRDISLWGLKITVRSTDPDDAAIVSGTVIDCEDSGRGFVFRFGETAESVVAGFTIINGNGGPGGLMGGGLYIASGSSPIVRNCIIVDCSASFGGAIAVSGYSLPTIRNCRILGNTAGVGGGALYVNGGGPVFDNCIISGNSAPRGGAVYSHNPGDPVLAHCTITSNTATTFGGAINCFNESNLVLYGCILWDNVASTGSQMLVGGIGMPVTMDVSYCNVQGIDTDVVVFPPSVVNWGLGNIEADPMFIEAGYMEAASMSVQAEAAYVEGDFGLMEESPCVDTGDPDYVAEDGATDVYGAQRLVGEAIDIGAAEFVIEELETIEAKIKFQPRVINLRGKQKWLICTIKLKDYKSEEIDPKSILLEGTIEPKWTKKFNRGKNLVVRFDMEEIRNLLDDSQKRIELTVQGTLKDDTTLTFAGSGTLKVYRKKVKDGKK